MGQVGQQNEKEFFHSFKIKEQIFSFCAGHYTKHIRNQIAHQLTDHYICRTYITDISESNSFTLIPKVTDRFFFFECAFFHILVTVEI